MVDRVYLSLHFYHSGCSSINVSWRRCEDLNSADTLTFALKGFEDYGAYWRYNYETIEEEPQYRYTRDELMHDVRSVYNQVEFLWGKY